jgi:hypothetical protein
MFVLQAREVLLPRRIVPETPDSGLREGPRERGSANLRTGGPGAFARGLLGTLHEATRGDAVVDAGEAGAVMPLVEQHQTQNFADAGDRLEPVEALRIRLLRCREDRSLAGMEESIRVGKQSTVAFDTFVHGGIREPLGPPLTVGFIGNLFADLRQVIRAVGLLDMGE